MAECAETIFSPELTLPLLPNLIATPAARMKVQQTALAGGRKTWPDPLIMKRTYLEE